MSYILDALKKSEKERGNKDIPSVQTIHSSGLNYNNKKTNWPYYLIAAVLLNLFAILYFVFDNQDDLTVEKTVENILPTPKNESKVAAFVQKEETQIAAIAKPIQEATNSKIILGKAPKPQLKNNTIVKNTKPKIINTPPTVNAEITEFQDLPAEIKLQLPTITISAHVYSSNPLQRSIVINNNFLEEGEYVLDDLILHEITPDGAIFNHLGTLFHYGIVSTWR